MESLSPRPPARRRPAATIAAALAFAAAFPLAGGTATAGAPPAPGGSPPAAAATPPPARPIRVALARGVDRVDLGAPGEYEVLDAAGRPLLRGRGDRSAAFTVNGSALALNGAAIAASECVLRALAADGLVSAGARRYRGELRVRLQGGRLLLLNVLDVESYLLGVVPREMPAWWPAEALKAQAVVARTYALYQMAAGKYRHEGFDVLDTTDSQVYGGADAEDDRTTRAVRETAGRVVVYGGRPILAYFHSSSGGHTEDSKNVWGQELPYLRGVPDFDQASPRYSWRRFVSREELEERLAAAGIRVGQIRALEPDGPRGVSGRWTTLAVRGGAGSARVAARVLRSALGLDSTLFEIVPREARTQEVRQALVSSQRVAVLAANGRREAALHTLAARARGGQPRALAAAGEGWAALGRAAVPSGFELIGRGWGHGTGMSQWGAKAMAERGASHQAIIGYYYQGTAIATMPDPGAAAAAP